MRTGKSHAVHVIVWHVTLHSYFFLGSWRRPTRQRWRVGDRRRCAPHMRQNPESKMRERGKSKEPFEKQKKTEIPFNFPVTNSKKQIIVYDMMKRRSISQLNSTQLNSKQIFVTDNKGRIFLVALGFFWNNESQHQQLQSTIINKEHRDRSLSLPPSLPHGITYVHH